MYITIAVHIRYYRRAGYVGISQDWVLLDVHGCEAPLEISQFYNKLLTF